MFQNKKLDFIVQNSLNCITDNDKTWLLFLKLFPHLSTAVHYDEGLMVLVKNWTCTESGRCTWDCLTCRPLEEKPYCHKHANLQCHLRHVGPVLVQQCLLLCLFVGLLLLIRGFKELKNQIHVIDSVISDQALLTCHCSHVTQQHVLWVHLLFENLENIAVWNIHI